jgi:WD40 repeat protein
MSRVALGICLFLLMGSGSGELRAQSGSLSAFEHLTLEAREATSLAFSADGRLLAVGSRDGRVRILDVESGTEVQAFRPSNSRVVGLGFVPSGSRLFAALEDRHIILLDLISSLVVRETRTERRIAALDVSSDGRLLVWGGEDGTVEVLTETLQAQQSLSAPGFYRKDVRFVAFGLEDREIVAVAEEGNVAYWALGAADPVRTEALTRQDVVALARDPSGTVLAMGIKALGVVRARTMNAGGALVAQATHTIRILDWERGRTIRDIEEIPDEIQTLAWAPNRTVVLAGLRDGSMGAYSVEEGRLISTLHQGDEYLASAFSPDGRWIAATFDGRGGRIWRASGAEAVARPQQVYRADEFLGRPKFEFTSASEPLISRTEQYSVAVLGLANLGVEEAVAATVSELLTTRISNYPNLTPIERSAIEDVLGELRFQNTGVTSAQDAAQIGQMLNAGVVVLGSLNQLGTTTVISVRLVDTESARIMGARELVCNSCQLEDLPAAVGVLAESLVEG